MNGKLEPKKHAEEVLEAGLKHDESIGVVKDNPAGLARVWAEVLNPRFTLNAAEVLEECKSHKNRSHLMPWSYPLEKGKRCERKESVDDLYQGVDMEGNGKVDFLLALKAQGGTLVSEGGNIFLGRGWYVEEKENGFFQYCFSNGKGLVQRFDSLELVYSTLAKQKVEYAENCGKQSNVNNSSGKNSLQVIWSAKELDVFRKRYDDLKLEHAKLEARCVQFQNNYRETLVQVTALSKKLQRAASICSEAKTKRHIMRNRIKSLQGQLKSAEKDRDELSARLKEKAVENIQLQTFIQKLQSAVREKEDSAKQTMENAKHQEHQYLANIKKLIDSVKLLQTAARKESADKEALVADLNTKLKECQKAKDVLVYHFASKNEK
eukprot:Nk52_evm5s382 gene=Nk52_evmTU5s382